MNDRDRWESGGRVVGDTTFNGQNGYQIWAMEVPLLGPLILLVNVCWKEGMA